MIVGIIIAILICTLITAIIIFIFFRKRRNKRDEPNSTSNTEDVALENKENASTSALPPLPKSPSFIAEKTEVQNISDVEVQKLLGSGQFGDVYLGLWTNTKVALKQVKDGNNVSQVSKEIQVFQLLNHPHVVKMFGIYNDPEKGMFIVMEFMDQGSLENLIIDRFDEFKIPDMVNFAHQGFKKN